MWWLDPGKEVLNVLFNRILAPYVENLDLDQVNYGIAQGQLTLRNLRLKRGVLDKFQLPVDVLEGHLGTFTLSLHWMNLGNQPVEVYIEDVYLLVVPSAQTNISPEEEEERAQAAKAERLENAELLHMQGRPENDNNSPQSQGLVQSLITKVINNLQVTVKNIHIRYEDSISVPGHPFAAGLTLAGFAAVSVNDKWEPVFIESTAGAIHKLARLQSLAMYVDTDSQSMAGLPRKEAIERFSAMIDDKNGKWNHQYILKPVTGEGRVIVNHKTDRETPRFNIELLFDEIGIGLDNDQYRDAISLVDMYHVYMRKHQYRKFQPSPEEIEASPARARLRYAANAILAGVQEKNRKWTWKYFEERRDDRRLYVSLFQKKMLSPALLEQDLADFEKLEKKLSYEDIRFYRSIAKSRLRKDEELRKKIEEEKKKQEQPKQGWGSWLWGSTTEAPKEDALFGGNMTDEQRKQLYDVLDYDEKSTLMDALQAPRDSLNMLVTAKLKRGSFTLRTDPHGDCTDIMSVVFDVFNANFIQRHGNFETTVSLQDLRVFDGTTKNTLYPQIVRVKREVETVHTAIEDVPGGPETISSTPVDPFFLVKFENNPLDDRADSALTVRMRHMEIIYFKGYVEAIYRFFKPPASQLESVEALLNAASHTLEGLRKETRAGLEYALQNHKTIDIQLDMNAPIIIIPEDITSSQCTHLIIDAGHIAVESELGDKQAIHLIHQKRNQIYTDEDYQELESLMYDKLSLNLQDAQFIIGNNLEECRTAMDSPSRDNLHLLERISIGLQIQKSIVPTAANLAQVKVLGNLPSLNMNLSDTKYRSLMRLIDVCIPNFDDEPGQISPRPSLPTRKSHTSYKLPVGFFEPVGEEYNVDEGEISEESEEGSDDGSKEEFFEADNGSGELQLRQRIFQLEFRVGILRATISKSNSEGVEKPLGELSLEGFALFFALHKYHMNVDINLRSVSTDIIHPGGIINLISTPTNVPGAPDLLQVKYTRVQKDSPEFQPVYEGIDQNVDVKMSTLVFRVAPEPVLATYDFIMTTLVPTPANNAQAKQLSIDSPEGSVSEEVNTDGKIRVLVKLESVKMILENDSSVLATLNLSVADVVIFLQNGTLRVSGRLGDLTLDNDKEGHKMLPEFNQLLSIEGQNFADFVYETFDPTSEQHAGVNSSFRLNAASLKLNFLEAPLQAIYVFLLKLARLKYLYDAATMAAVQTAAEMGRFQFTISVKSPILVFPLDASTSSDCMTMSLGHIEANNSFDLATNKIFASLHGIKLESLAYGEDGTPHTLKIIDNIDIDADIAQHSGIDRTKDTSRPDTQISVRVSDVKLRLTQQQYMLLNDLSRAIPRAFSDAAPASDPLPVGTDGKPAMDPNARTTVNLQPELRGANGSLPVWTSLDLVVIINAVKLHLFDGSVISEDQLKEHGIARFALSDNSLRLKQLNDGSMEAQVILRSFTMSNIRSGPTKFREIIPAAQHDRNQFMILYTSSASSSTSQAILTIDSPQIIFAIDPVFMLMQFFTDQNQPIENASVESNDTPEDITPSGLDLRVDLHEVSISVLEDETDVHSRAIRLQINEVLFSQQGIAALNIQRLGMSLIQMGAPNEDSARFLDDVDLTVSLDSRLSSAQQMTSIEISAKPIVFRASYRDINLITTIFNKAYELYSESSSKEAPESPTRTSARRQNSAMSVPSATTSGATTVGKAKAIMSKEQLKASFDGFRLILIGDMHEQPMLYLKVKPFIVGARDWSGALQATTTLATQITYWNLTNSHWEPLIDPWTFTMRVSKENATGSTNVSLAASEKLDINLSTTFVELALTTLNSLTKDDSVGHQKGRGVYAPYHIRNSTGIAIFVWSDTETTGNVSGDGDMLKIVNDQIVDWRFGDWRTVREHVSSAQHAIGLQFIDHTWEPLRGVPVDREGEYVFSLRPRTEKYPTRVLFEVKVVNNTKIITIRSTYKIQNSTLYPLEIMLVDDNGHPVNSLEKVAPGQDYSLPIQSVTQHRVRIQPDQGFGYKWCAPLRWEDLLARKSFAIKCPHSDFKEGAFRFQAWAQTDNNEHVPGKYPKITLRLRAPLELENLLPYNLEYRIYDKNTDQNWRSYLRKGGIMPIHSVELAHFILLNVSLQDSVFKPSEFAIINTDGHSDFDIERRVTLKDRQDRKLDLRLNYIRYPESGGAFKVQIYSPYLIINKTGLPLSVRSTRSTRAGYQDAAGDSSPDVTKTSAPFLLSHSQTDGHEFIFKFGESTWSKMISFEAPSAETELSVFAQRNSQDQILAGLSWSEGQGKYQLTKVVVLSPRFLVRNKLPYSILFREHGYIPRERAVLPPGERAALRMLRSPEERLITFAASGLNAQWTPPISLESIGSVHVRLCREGGAKDLIKADVVMDGSVIFVLLSQSEEWPFEIENDSDYSFELRQKDASRESAKDQPVYSLAAHSKLEYAWDFPASKEKRILLSTKNSRRVIDIMEIGDLIPFKFMDNRKSSTVSIDVRAQGQKQILRISNYIPEQSLYRPKQRSRATSISRQDTLSSVEGFEAITEDVKTTFTFTIDWSGIGLSLINKRLVEVIYMNIENLKLEYTDSTIAQAININFGSLQIDNQLHDAIFPVILQPTPIAKDASGVGALPTIQASVIWLKDQAHGVVFVKYCSVLMQALTIEADEDLLFAIYDLTQIKGASWETEIQDILIANPTDISDPSVNSVGQALYFEVLELQPIRLSLSFMRTERVNSEAQLSIRNPLAVIVNALTMTVGNINDAPLEMNALGIKDMRLSTSELQDRIFYHYRQDVLRQLYRILGSADFIGNPVGLFTNVSSGVADIFYEPFQGVVMHGNRELGIGIAKGAASFVKKTVFGLSDSVTKFTSSVGKGLSAATFDSEYQARRRMTQRRNRPKHAIYGVAAGGEALASSFSSAMEGVFMKPIEGAESEGAFGFFKGVGKGLVGAVTKPVIGVFDLASNVSEGIRNTTTVFDNPERDRSRLPRLIPADGVLKSYSSREAQGQYWMKDLNNGAYRKEHYVAHITSPAGDNVVLLTQTQVLSFYSRKLRLDWELPLTQVQGVTAEDNGIRFAHRLGKAHDKFALIPDKSAQSWFFNQVASVVRSFNSRRRMDA